MTRIMTRYGPPGLLYKYNKKQYNLPTAIFQKELIMRESLCNSLIIFFRLEIYRLSGASKIVMQFLFSIEKILAKL